MLGTRMQISVSWTDDGAIEMHQRTTRGKTTTEATITQRYDPTLDRIVSENDSVEGFYTRTFKRVGGGRGSPSRGSPLRGSPNARRGSPNRRRLSPTRL